MIVNPKIRGFICTTAHPAGCEAAVNEQVDFVTSQEPIAGPKKVLIIGSSTGYGLSSRIAATYGANAQTIGVFAERAAAGKKTATPGWYNTAAFEKRAQKDGYYAKSINGDAFSDETKQKVIDLIEKDWGGEVDLIVYSLAAPKRTDPHTNVTYNSVLKPVGEPYTNKTVNIHTGEVTHISIEPATEDEINATRHVMGGADWQLWIEKLLAENLLSKGVKTVAYSYIGPVITHPIYRSGTIGLAKEDLEQTANKLNERLSTALDGEAVISVNKGLVTQASAAIPIVPLYISLLYDVMKKAHNHEGCIEQINRLFRDHLYSSNASQRDSEGRIRVDDFEMSPEIQEQVELLWPEINDDNIYSVTDLEGYQDDFLKLFGFNYQSIDYDADVEINVPIPSINE